MLRLFSAEREVFEIDRALICGASVTISNASQDLGDDTLPLPLPNVASRTLRWILEYLQSDADGKRSLVGDLTAGDMVEALISSNYLDIPELIDVLVDNAARTIRRAGTPESIRRIFGITNDLTEEDQQRIHLENEWAMGEQI